MQLQSIVSIFIVLCLIVVTFFGNVVEGGRALRNTKQNNIHPNKNNYFVQRLRRKVRNTHRRSKRDDDNDNSFDNQNVSNDGNIPADLRNALRRPMGNPLAQSLFQDFLDNNNIPDPFPGQRLAYRNQFNRSPNQDQPSYNDQGFQFGDQR